MSFVSFLKKAGQVLANIGAVEAGLEPIFKQILPASYGPTVDKLDLAVKNVIAVEGMFQLAYPGQQTGPQKLLASSTLVAPLLASLDSVAGTHVVDSAAKQAAILKITGGIADYVNSLGGGNTGTAAVGAVLPAPAASIASEAPKV